MHSKSKIVKCASYNEPYVPHAQSEKTGKLILLRHKWKLGVFCVINYFVRILWSFALLNRMSSKIQWYLYLDASEVCLHFESAKGKGNIYERREQKGLHTNEMKYRKTVFHLCKLTYHAYKLLKWNCSDSQFSLVLTKIGTYLSSKCVLKMVSTHIMTSVLRYGICVLMTQDHV